MLGCSRGHSFAQHMFEYTLPFESTLKDNMKIDFEGIHKECVRVKVQISRIYAKLHER